jgi:hypothetical protein
VPPATGFDSTVHYVVPTSSIDAASLSTVSAAYSAAAVQESADFGVKPSPPAGVTSSNGLPGVALFPSTADTQNYLSGLGDTAAAADAAAGGVYWPPAYVMVVNLGGQSQASLAASIFYEYAFAEELALSPSISSSWFASGVASYMKQIHATAFTAGAALGAAANERSGEAYSQRLALDALGSNAWRPLVSLDGNNFGSSSADLGEAELAVLRLVTAHGGVATLKAILTAQVSGNFPLAFQKVVGMSEGSFDSELQSSLQPLLSASAPYATVTVHIGAVGSQGNSLYIDSGSAAGSSAFLTSSLSPGDYRFIINPSGGVTSADGNASVVPASTLTNDKNLLTVILVNSASPTGIATGEGVTYRLLGGRLIGGPGQSCTLTPGSFGTLALSAVPLELDPTTSPFPDGARISLTP